MLRAASSIDVRRQNVRNKLMLQDPESILKYNEEIIKKIRKLECSESLSSLPWTARHNVL